MDIISPSNPSSALLARYRIGGIAVDKSIYSSLRSLSNIVLSSFSIFCFSLIFFYLSLTRNYAPGRVPSLWSLKDGKFG